MTFIRRVILLPFALVLTLSIAQSTQTGMGGAAATVDRFATEAAISVLKLGGNAVDAAVTAAAVLNVTNPFSVGIGGGGFMVIYLADEDRVVTLDMREMAPGAATPDMFIDSATGEPIPFFPERVSSGLAVGIPGTLLG
ncbi:MAG TPA: gamma-glutamyltransferase, partial [Chloroflexota bacterium]|nr:gamma-glutamyltransferase [Chloroflexota bacterium]